MSLRWRWALVAIIAATVFGSFMPNTLRWGIVLPGRSMALLMEEPPATPIGCLDASCSRGAPVPAPTPLTVVAIGTAIAGMLSLAARRMARRGRPNAIALPRGTSLVLLHPPQCS